jgi:NAD(P)-dependent dehydrogenase (short-subunit alcohol dehydrogenase family)
VAEAAGVGTEGRGTRTAVVTGASAGIGAEIARALGGLGWRVAIGARREERLAEVARGVAARGGEPFAYALDVSETESIERFFDAVERRFGPADVVVNNAGLSIPGRLFELSADDIRYQLSVNLVAPMLVCRRAIPPLLEGGGGDLVFISSDASRLPRPQQTPYSAAKAGMEVLAHGLGMELEGTGIRCTIVRPGAVLSEYAADWGEERISELVGYWQHWGLQRHRGTLPAAAVARAVVAAVTSPPGVCLDTIEVQPEAPPVPGAR